MRCNRGCFGSLGLAAAVILAATIVAAPALGAQDELEKGRTLLEQGKLDEAIGVLEAILDKNPEDAGAHALMAKALLEYGDVDGALGHAQSALAKSPQDAGANLYAGAALYWKARAAIDEGKVSGYVASLFSDALARLEAAVKADPESLEAYQYLGLVYFYQENFDAAKKALEKCTEIAPDDAFAYFQIGEVHQVQQQYEEAIPYYEKAVAREPNYTEAHRKIGLCNEFLGRTEAAAAAYRAAILTAPDFLEPYKDIWRLYGEGENLANGASMMEELSKEISGHYPVYWYLGHYLSRLQKGEEAIAAFEKVLELNPNATGAWVEIANIRIDAGNLPAAIDALKKGFAAEKKLNPELSVDDSPSFQKMMEVSGLFGFRREFKEAEALLQYLVKEAPENGYVWNNLGLVYRDWGKFEESLKAYEKAVEFLPYDAQVLNDYGVVLDYHFNRGEEASKYYKKAVEISENVDAIENLTRFYLRSGQFEECIRMADRGLKLDPNRLVLRNYKTQAEAKLKEGGESSESGGDGGSD